MLINSGGRKPSNLILPGCTIPTSNSGWNTIPLCILQIYRIFMPINWICPHYKSQRKSLLPLYIPSLFSLKRRLDSMKSFWKRAGWHHPGLNCLWPITILRFFILKNRIITRYWKMPASATGFQKNQISKPISCCRPGWSGGTINKWDSTKMPMNIPGLPTWEDWTTFSRILMWR